MTHGVYHEEHETYHALDHAYDDQHDIEPVHFHEQAVLKAVPREVDKP